MDSSLERQETLIIGAGLAGLSTALHLSSPALILEAEAEVGGKARTEEIEGFRFDQTGHWLHLRDPQIKALLFRLLTEDHFVEVKRISRIWSQGRYTHYPFQANTFGLPPETIKKCVMGAFKADLRRRLSPEVAEPEDFREWIRFYFGEGIAGHFMLPYNARLWGVAAEEITSRWCQRFVPRPNLEEIVAGAVGCHAEGMGYNARFLYPKEGGIQSLPLALAKAVGRAQILLEAPVSQINLKAHEATLSDGRRFGFERLVSTMPLPQLIACIQEAPPEIRAAASRLRATNTHYYNVGLRGGLSQPDHWIYLPEERWPMYRVGSFSNALSKMAPPGCSSLYVELADRGGDSETLRASVVEGLLAMELIQEPQQILFMAHRIIPQGYVLYDFEHAEAREQVLSWLERQGVISTGRYGDWNYSSMEDALLDGRRAAERLERRTV